MLYNRHPTIKDINVLRYAKFAEIFTMRPGPVLSSYDRVDTSLLPPCRDALNMHKENKFPTIFDHLYLFLRCMLVLNVSLFFTVFNARFRGPLWKQALGLKGPPWFISLIYVFCIIYRVYICMFIGLSIF